MAASTVKESAMPGIEARPADVIRTYLEEYLGPFTAANALKLYSRQALATEPEKVTPAQVPQLLDALTPTLRTLIGGEATSRLVSEVRREFAF
jgi:hypothetical protein